LATKGHKDHKKEAKMIEDHWRIPICESEFLQDVSIELGKRLKAIRYAAKGERLEFRTSTTENDHAIGNASTPFAG
jgi:hypothetical protein